MRVLAAALLFGTSVASAADYVAEVTMVERVATAADAIVETVSVGHRLGPGVVLATDATGRMGAFFESRRAKHREIELAAKAKVKIDTRGEGFTLLDGTTRASGAFGAVPEFRGKEFLTGNASIDAHSTFVVTYDPIENITEVVVVSGRVTVRNRKGGPEVVLLARGYSRVVGDMEPSRQQFLADEEYERRLAPFVFIGRGRPESLSMDFALRTEIGAPENVVNWWPWPGENKPFEQPRNVVEETLVGIDF
jgi:hypothetical protein